MLTGLCYYKSSHESWVPEHYLPGFGGFRLGVYETELGPVGHQVQAYCSGIQSVDWHLREPGQWI